jgi:hypothetical protein
VSAVCKEGMVVVVASWKGKHWLLLKWHSIWKGVDGDWMSE